MTASRCAMLQGESLLDEFEFAAEVLDGLGGVEVEDRLAIGAPLGAIVKEHGTSGAEVSDVGVVFHTAPFDRAKLNSDPHKGAQTPRAAISREADGAFEVDIDPLEPAGLTRLRGELEELGFEPFAAKVEILACPGDGHGRGGTLAREEERDGGEDQHGGAGDEQYKRVLEHRSAQFGSEIGRKTG